MSIEWIAGLFEGEGTIRINSFTARNWGALIVSITNTDEALLRPFLRFGGKIRPATGMRPDQRAAWRWTIAATQAAAFVRIIKPHLVSPRNRARCKVALAFQAGKKSRHHQGPTYRAEQMAAFLAMKELNMRGPNAKAHRKDP